MPRKHLNNLESTFTSASTGATSVTVTPPPADLAAGEYFWATIVDDVDATTQRETVKVTAAVSGALTFEPALANDYPSGGVVIASNPAVLFDEVDGVLVKSYKEQIKADATAALLWADGPWQQLAISANTTITVPDLPTGANITVDMSGDFTTYSVTFPAGLWQGAGGPPDISAATGPRFLIENRGDTLLLSYLGDYA